MNAPSMNKPVFKQYSVYMKGLIIGDLVPSFQKVGASGNIPILCGNISFSVF